MERSDSTNNNEAAKEKKNGAKAEKATEAKDAQELAQVKEQLKEQEGKFLYLYAEFENFKKRAIKERSDILKFGSEPLMRELLLVCDNLDRALLHTENKEAIVTGIKMVQEQLNGTLQKFGVSPLKAVGEKFDPQVHEAVGQDVAENGTEEGSILREEQKGFSLHGRLLRPSRVIVAMNTEQKKNNDESGEKK